MTATASVRGRAAAGVPLLVALLLAACTSEPDPQAELERALAATAAEPFTFALTAEADRPALEQLGDDAVAAAAFLEDAGVTGGREPSGRLHVAITLGGEAPLLEVIAGEGDGLLLRTGLGAVLGLQGRDPGEDLDPALDALGVSPAGRDALATSFAGGWVELTDVGDLGALVGTADGEASPPADPLDLLGAVTVTGARDAGEVRRLDVEVAVATLLAPFGVEAAGGTVPGTVDLRDGRLLEVRLELSGGDLAAAGDGGAGGGDATGGDEAGSGGVVELVLDVAPADDEAVVERPEPGASLTAAELSALVEQLQGAGASPP